MAVTSLVPEDRVHLTPLKEASALLAETGFPASRERIRRGLIGLGARIERHGKTDFVDMDDVWPWHRDCVVKPAKGR